MYGTLWVNEDIKEQVCGGGGVGGGGGGGETPDKTPRRSNPGDLNQFVSMLLCSKYLKQKCIFQHCSTGLKSKWTTSNTQW